MPTNIIDIGDIMRQLSVKICMPSRMNKRRTKFHKTSMSRLFHSKLSVTI